MSRTFVNPVRRAISVAFLLVLVSAIIVCVWKAASKDDDPVFSEFFVCALALCAIVDVRAVRNRVTISEDGIVIRNTFRTYRFLWREVGRFELLNGAGWLMAWGPGIRLKSGKVFQLNAIAPTYLMFRRGNSKSFEALQAAANSYL